MRAQGALTPWAVPNWRLLLLNGCLRYEGVMYYGINIDLNPT